jgi:orotidine-5'-phosphate decarboxylase
MSRPAIANPVFVALDMPSVDAAVALAEKIRPHVGGLKVGLEFIAANGPEGVRKMVGLGLPVFADVKFHDIPNTVAGAAREIAKLGVKIFNVHASGGAAMMAAARDAAKSVDPNLTIIGVTVLTSLAGEELFSVGQGDDTLLQVHRLARLTQSAGLDGVVCSPREIGVIRAECGPDFLIVTPGVRPKGAVADDQRRVLTPAEAVKAGADILVVGRPITGAADPAEAARVIACDAASRA